MLVGSEEEIERHCLSRFFGVPPFPAPAEFRKNGDLQSIQIHKLNKGGSMLLHSTVRNLRFFLRNEFFPKILLGGIVLMMAAGPAVTQSGWTKASAQGISFEIPGHWVFQAMENQNLWYLGDLSEPEAVFAVITEEVLSMIMEEAPITSKKDVIVGSRSGIYHSVFDPEDGSTGFIITFAGQDSALMGVCGNQDKWNTHKSTFDHIIASIRFDGSKERTEGCQAFTPDPRAFATQPGGVLPMRWEYDPGKYLIHIAEAGKYGTDTPKIVKTYGPYELVAGSNYRALINDDGDIPAQPGNLPLPYLKWEKDHSTLISYSKPVGGKARVYVRNEVPGDMFYALCLEPWTGGGTIVSSVTLPSINMFRTDRK